MSRKPVKTVTHHPNETEQLGVDLAKNLRPGDVVALYGDLGSGKTTFVRGLAQALGITQPIRSPTFTLIHEYPLPGELGRLFHIDLYRLENPDDVFQLGLEELIPAGITVIEWADRASSLLPDERTEVHFEILQDQERSVTITHQPASIPSSF